jgi:hypothetical protein
MPSISIDGVSSSYNQTGSNAFYDVPTNPKMTLNSYANNDKLYTIIYEDGTISNDEFKRGADTGTILTQFSNLHNTEGFVLRCFDSNTGEGVNFNPTGNDSLDNYEYYVLIHSDNKLMYHFAKITSILTLDPTDPNSAGDSFTFSPRMGNEIPKGVKFKIFKGPPVASLNKIVAISAGISKDIPLLNIARPYFYFYNDKLEKKGELNHNTKYMLKSNISNDLTTYSSSSAIVVNTTNRVFLTVSDYRHKIIDYSKFSYNIKLVDKLRELDDPDIATSNESNTLQGQFITNSDYNTIFINARRVIDDQITNPLDLTGPKRYVYYNFSPEDNNRMPSIYEINIADSFDVKAGYASIKMIDSTKNLSNKIDNNDRLFVNQKLKEESFNDWVEVGEIVSNVGLLYTLTGDVERPNLYFSAGNEILIGNRICIVNSISSTNQIALNTSFGIHPRTRLETQSKFTTAIGLVFAQGTKVYRRRVNPVDNTFFTNAIIPPERLDKLNGIIISNQYKNFYCTMGNFITNADKDYGLITINFENNLLDNDNALRYVMGELLLNYQVFFGFIEEISKKLENNQSIFEVQGRNTLSKLVDVIINKNTLFSEDFILTAESPFNNTQAVGYATWDENNPHITFDSAQTLVAGDHLWNRRGGYIGEVKIGNTGTGFVLVQAPSFKCGSNVQNNERHVYKETDKNYIFGKALASNRYVSSVTSLAGASDKGLYFRTGNKLIGDYSSNYSEGVKLAGLSEHNDANALGFNIENVESLLNDLPFQAKLSGLNAPVVNSLIDFTILGVKENDGIKTVKLAPYMPLTLGREVENYLNFEHPTTSGGNSKLVTMGSFVSYSNTDKNIRLNSDDGLTDISKIRTLRVGEPLFANNNFIGRYIGDDIAATADGIDIVHIYLDRAVSLTSGDLIQFLDTVGNMIRSLHLINGGHLQNNRLIDLVSPTQNQFSPRFYNYDLEYAIANPSIHDPETYAFKYRSKPHRIFNLEKGLIGEKNYTLVNLIADNDITPFYADDAIFNYYADTYSAFVQTLGNEFADNVYPKAIPTNGLLGVQLPIGMRGIRPITYSNFSDKRYYLSHANNKFLFALNPQNKNSFIAQTGEVYSTYPNPLLVRDKLQQLDPRAARLFLYANRDKTFYSSRRRDSLLNDANSVSIENYGLFSSKKPKLTNHSIAKDNIFGNTVSYVNFDSDYQHTEIISSNKTVSNLKRFSIMRLTECVFDSFMNPINPEFDISGDASISASNIDMADIYTSTTTFSSTSFQSNSITMSGAVSDIVQGDIIIDETNNRMLGQVSSISGNNNEIINFYGTLQHCVANDGSNSLHTANDSKLSGFSYVSGDNVKYIKYTEIARYVSIGGRLEDSVLFKYGNDGKGINQLNYSPPNFHLLKGLIVNEDKLDTWGNYYIERTETDNIDSSSDVGVDHMEQVRKTDNQANSNTNANQYDIQNIMLPYCFHGIIREGQTASPSLVLPHPSNPNYFSGSHADSLTNIPINEGFWQVSTAGFSPPTRLRRWVYEKSAQKDIASWDIFRWIDGLNFGNQGSKENRQKINSFKIVGLKTFGTEDTSKDSIPSHIVSPFLSYASLGYVFRYQDVGSYTMNEGKSIIYPMLGTTIEAGNDMVADKKVSSAGIYLGMKFHVSITGNETFETLSNNYKSYQIPMENELIFLKMVDLTGCYLVPSGRGKTIVNGGLTNNTSTNTSHNLTPFDEEIVYVVAHEYDMTSAANGELSILVTDKALTAGEKYKIMQPNPVCFWENSPKKIQLNTLTSAYTKKMDSDDMISDPPCWEDYQTSGTMSNVSAKEGVQSMYVIADLDKITNSSSLILRTSAHLSTILNVDTEMCLSDGESNLVCNVKGVEGLLGVFNFLEIAEMKKLKGIVSATETFELEVKGDITNDSERAIIGTTVAISKDIEDTVEELLRINDIKHTIIKENYDVFNTTNFKGTNLFETINYLLNKKDKKLTYIEDTIKITNFDDDDFVAQFSLTDDDITEINTVKSKFNYFNEIVVFGKHHKGIRKNLKEIQKNGKKTLEINEPKLTSKEDVDKLAQEKLLIHTRLQELIEIKVPISKINTLTVGETIILESKVAGLLPRPYIVLEKILTFDGLIRLKLGQYLKGIEDILSSLISENIKTQSHLRDNFNANENTFDLFSKINIKEMHLLIRKKAVSGGFFFGFGTQLNTNTNTLGFGGGSTTFTTLKEEDL